MTGVLRGLVAVLALSGGACDDVPMLSFENDDGGGGAPLPDASVAGHDGGGAPTPDDTGLAEASGDAACPDQVPGSASVCCGSVACNGNCTADQCSLCEMQCGTATLCCAKTNNVSCRPMDAPCP
jgi:hypothetical protein